MESLITAQCPEQANAISQAKMATETFRVTSKQWFPQDTMQLIWKKDRKTPSLNNDCFCLVL
jgi:hypothetical protein